MNSINRDQFEKQLTTLLEKYISPFNVRAVCSFSSKHCAPGASDLSPQDVEHIVEKVMAGLRLFCPPERLPELMVELAAFCKEMSSP